MKVYKTKKNIKFISEAVDGLIYAFVGELNYYLKKIIKLIANKLIIIAGMLIRCAK